MAGRVFETCGPYHDQQVDASTLIDLSSENKDKCTVLHNLQLSFTN